MGTFVKDLISSGLQLRQNLSTDDPDFAGILRVMIHFDYFSVIPVNLTQISVYLFLWFLLNRFSDTGREQVEGFVNRSWFMMAGRRRLMFWVFSCQILFRHSQRGCWYGIAFFVHSRVRPTDCDPSQHTLQPVNDFSQQKSLFHAIAASSLSLPLSFYSASSDPFSSSACS